MRFLCWWMLLVALLPSVCYCPKLPTDEEVLKDYKEDLRKFREQESGQAQVSLLMNVLERYELYDEVNFASRDFEHKFARVRQFLLKLDMIEEGKVVQEVGSQPKDEDSDNLRQKYAIPRIDPTWKRYRWKHFWEYFPMVYGFIKHDSQAWSIPLAYLVTNVDINSERLPEKALYHAHWLYNGFQDDLNFEQARQNVETNFPRFKQQITNRIERFFGMLLSVVKLDENSATVDPPNIKKYLEKLNLWSEPHNKAWLDLLRRLIDHPPEQIFDRNVQIPHELRIFVQDKKIVELMYFVKIFVDKYETVCIGSTHEPWNESIFLNKVHLMVLWNIKLFKLEDSQQSPQGSSLGSPLGSPIESPLGSPLRSPLESPLGLTPEIDLQPATSHNTQTDQNCIYPCLGYVLASAGTIASLGLLFNKLAYGQFLPDWPTQVNTTLPWNSATLVTTLVTQQSSGWTNWQVVALVVVVAIIIAVLSGLALVYYRYFQATGTDHLNISGKDTADTTTTGNTSTSSASSDNNKPCSKSTKNSSQVKMSTLDI